MNQPQSTNTSIWRRAFDEAVSGKPYNNTYLSHSDEWYEYDSGYQFGREWIGK